MRVPAYYVSFGQFGKENLRTIIWDPEMTCEKRRRNVSQNLENWDDKISQIEWQKYSCSNSYLFFFFRLSSANFFDWTALKAVEPIQHEPLTRSFLPQKLGFLICLGKISYLSCGSFKYISSQLLKDDFSSWY